MNIRQRKRMIYLAATLVVSAGVALVNWGLLTPVRLPGDAEAKAPPAVGTDGAASVATESAADASASPSISVSASKLARLCRRDLRRPLFDPPPKQRAVEKNQTPEPTSPMSVQLVGVFVEPGRSMAVFQMKDGSLEVCGMNDAVETKGGDVTVKRITLHEVTVEYGNETRTLLIERTPNHLVFRPDE